MKKEKPKIEGREPMCVAWGLLGAWYCVPADLAKEEYPALCDKIRENAGVPPGIEDDLILDRLYGGFLCGECADRRHVYLASGEYTYLGANWPNDHRPETWVTLYENNPERDGKGPFCEDAPKEPRS